MATKLNDTERAEALARLAGWSLVDGRDAIRRPLSLRRFQRGLRLHDPRGAGGRKADHHPEWFNVYRTVDVTLTTHDAKGLTALDIELAEAMDRIAGR